MNKLQLVCKESAPLLARGTGKGRVYQKQKTLQAITVKTKAVKQGNQHLTGINSSIKLQYKIWPLYDILVKSCPLEYFT